MQKEAETIAFKEKIFCFLSNQKENHDRRFIEMVMYNKSPVQCKAYTSVQRWRTPADKFLTITFYGLV